MSTTRIKASDRTKVCQQIVTELKKKYGSRTPKADRTVLDSLLFAICLEGTPHDQAEAALLKFQESFFDYNEARVSSITELQKVFVELSEPEWRAMRVRESLQIIFEGRYSYDIEDFKKKNLDAAEKYLKNIKSLTPFVIDYTMMTTLGSHTVPVNSSILECCIVLGLLPADTDISSAGDQLKAAVRKADAPLFFYLINELANDENYATLIHELDPPNQDDQMATLKHSAPHLKELLAGKLKSNSKPAKKSTSSSKTKSTAEKAPKKKTSKKTASTTAKKSSGTTKKKTAKKATKKK
ncbi:hypothetical protein [uncultured Rubinisphaera sp.]|uniref:hypothetical protein n=1 Tax=uncultured Rubinisphaera sp. TaxID=1678686 RepID=UPI0030DC431A|tara:strand:+ start:174 stop:1064 length:891 start_codon:yes stop_codon:yes gene_type:complete